MRALRRPFADDVAVLAGSHTDLRRQADKVSAYLGWSGMSVNHTKCGATGMLHGAVAQGLVQGGALSEQGVAMLRRRLDVTISGKPITFLHPDLEPYKYLGVWLTPTLNWRHQHKALKESAIETADAILRSPASAAQRLRLIETLLRPRIRYSFATGAYTAADIAQLDGLLACTAKYAWHLPRGTPTALVHEDRERGGMGVTSLKEEYVKEQTAALTDALNDPGRLGAVTCALLQVQVQAAGKVADTALADRLRHSRLLRALTLLQGAGGHMTHWTGGGQLEWMTLQGCDLTALLRRLRNDPLDLGLPGNVPLAVFRPLLEAGVTSVAQLLDAGGRHMVAASKLTAHLALHNLTAADTPALRRAHNRLTLLLSADPNEGPPRVWDVPTADLPADQRLVRSALSGGPATPPPDRYADGQLRITMFARAGEGMRGGDGEPAPVAQHTTGGTEPDQPTARGRVTDRPEWQLRTAAGGLLDDYVRKLRSEWHSHRRAHAGCPHPPWPHLRLPLDLATNQELQKWLCLHCKDTALLPVLYADSDVPARIVAEVRKSKHTGGPRPQKRRLLRTQLCYKVEWEPTVVAQHHVSLYAQLGYCAAATEPCLPEEGPWWAAEWGVPVVRVTWAASEEPADTFVERCGEQGARLVGEYTAAVAAEAAATAHNGHRARPSLVTPLEQQGVVQPPPPAWELADAWAMSRITLDVAQAHPELDVQPPQGCTPGFFLREAREGDGRWNEPVLHMHHPDGRWLGTITRARVEHLAGRYAAALAQRPELATSLKAGGFTQELALLMLRRQAAEKAAGGDAHKWQRACGAAQDAVVAAVQAAMGAEVELFASPLDVHASMPAYMSTHERDQLFGAGVDAYSCRWEGACYAYPPAD